MLVAFAGVGRYLMHLWGFFHGLVIFISQDKCLLRSDVRFDSFSS